MSSKKLREYMSIELPSISAQKRLAYRTDIVEVKHLFKILNKTVFDSKLSIPEFIIFQRAKDYWGLCEARDLKPDITAKKSNVRIHLSNKWYCKQWLIDTLAHEMCHQYQWDVYSKERVLNGMAPIMSHGPSFYLFRENLAQYGISLKKYHRMRNWFIHQNFFKC